MTSQAVHTVFGRRKGGGEHGVVFTKPEVAGFILDLVGYTEDRDLTKLRLLEPACGRGVFLVAAVRRLLAAARTHRVDIVELREAILAFDIDGTYVEDARDLLTRELVDAGVALPLAQELVQSWIQKGDFLLAETPSTFHIVVGNPPYVRLEQIPSALREQYQQRFTTGADRSDLYAYFFEKCLNLLRDDGVLSFICADRWILNRSGSRLRKFIGRAFKLSAYVDMTEVDPFVSIVSAYPSIAVLRRAWVDEPILAKMFNLSQEEQNRILAMQVPGGLTHDDANGATRLRDHSAPWILTSSNHVRVLRTLEERFDTLETKQRTTVRIGVATGADGVFIISGDATEIEAERLVPLVVRADLNRGEIRDEKRRLINAFEDDGRLINLHLYPGLEKYLKTHEDIIKERHIARKFPSSWFRTIDRVYSDTVHKPKLLIPDIAVSNGIVYDEGRYLPHHTLYYITSTEWDLEVLGGLLSSRIALFFVWSYAVKMRGGYLRFQAQILRRICVPTPQSLEIGLKDSLREAFRKRDFACLDELALKAYGMDAIPEFEFVDARR